MLIDLVPSFLDAIASADPMEGYGRYFDQHRPVLGALWRNYILDPDSPHAEQEIHRAVHANRDDLRVLLERVDVNQIAQDSLARCEDLLEVDSPVDVYLMIGVGGATFGELVIGGRGIAFVCLEHFTGRLNPDTLGMGLAPELLPIWISHGVAHTVRYTSPMSRSAIARILEQTGGSYDYWETGSRATVLELMINEGLAVSASKAVAPGFAMRRYLGLGSGQYRRLRRLEAFLRQTVDDELHQTGLGYRLRYFGYGLPASSRRVAGRVLPERSGYYLGYRMAETYVAQHGIAQALRATAEECLEADRRATAS